MTAALQPSEPEVLRQYKRLLWKIVHLYARRLPPPADKEGLAQELSLTLVRAAEGYNAELGIPFAPYLSLTMRRRAKQIVRRESRCGFREAPRETDSEWTVPLANMVNRDGEWVNISEMTTDDTRQELRWDEEQWSDLTKWLNPRQKYVFDLWFRNSLSMPEIGQRMGISKQRVKQLLDVAIRTVTSTRMRFLKTEWESICQ